MRSLGPGDQSPGSEGVRSGSYWTCRGKDTGFFGLLVIKCMVTIPYMDGQMVWGRTGLLV